MFGPSRFNLMASAIALLIVASGAAYTWRQSGWTWTSGVLAFMTLVGIGGVIESAIRRIVLDDDTLVVFDIWGRKRFDRSEIESVHEYKGSPPIMLLRNGRKVELPSVANAVSNSIRAWLKDDLY